MPLNLEPCNRCCSNDSELINDQYVKCNHCEFTESFEVWQLRGWRSILKYPPTYGGTIFVYGKKIGRKEALWNKELNCCSNPDATHWLRTPDPTKQIGM